VHLLGSRVRTDLDEIWRYIFTESGNEAIADRQIDSITNRFYLLAHHPRPGRARDDQWDIERRPRQSITA